MPIAGITFDLNLGQFVSVGFIAPIVAAIVFASRKILDRLDVNSKTDKEEREEIKRTLLAQIAEDKLAAKDQHMQVMEVLLSVDEQSKATNGRVNAHDDMIHRVENDIAKLQGREEMRAELAQAASALIHQVQPPELPLGEG